MTDRQTTQPTDRLSNGRTGGVIGKLHFLRAFGQKRSTDSLATKKNLEGQTEGWTADKAI